MAFSFLVSTIIPILLAGLILNYQSQKKFDPETEKLIDSRMKLFCPEDEP